MAESINPISNSGKNEESKFANLEKSDLLILLQNFSNLRTGQDQVLWSIIGAFWTTNSLLLVSIFATDRKDRFIVGLIISLVGILISWIWNHIQSSALRRIENYEKSIMFIEKELKIQFEICSFLRANSEEYLKNEYKKSARYVMKKFSKYAIYMWTTATIISTGYIIYSTFFTC